jgi:hypothetical protein
MNATLNHLSHRPTPQIVVVPTAAAHAEQMDALSALVYDHPLGNRVEEYRSAVQHFPEGLFVAVDEAAGGKVVGYTSSMRLDYDPANPLFEPWEQVTDYG